MIRFAQRIGFPKYYIFLEAFRKLLKEKLTSADRFNLSLKENQSNAKGTTGSIWNEIRTLTLLEQEFPKQSFNKAVEKICKSDQVYVIGTRGSASLAQYLAYFLSKTKRNVSPITCGSSTNYDRLLHLKKEDLVLTIAFPRYPRETVGLVKFAKKKGADIIAITDQIDSPIADLATHSIIIPITFSTIFDSYCSAFSLFNMLVTEIGRVNQTESVELFKEFEELAKEVKIFI